MIRLRRLGFVAAGPLLVLGALCSNGCGPTSSGIEGISCTQDSDCNSGLKCLPYQTFDEGGTSPAGGCTNVGTECLTPCKTDSDCASAGVGLVCFSACGGMPACEAPGEGVVSPDASAESGPEGGEAGADSAGGTSAEAASEAAPVEASGE